jgi:type I restriction enzyme M protein
MNPIEQQFFNDLEKKLWTAAELEVRDYYTKKNVFWVPVEARWQTLRDLAQLPPGRELPWNAPGKDVPKKMRTVGWLIDNAKLENAIKKNLAELGYTL